jgi:hypothetical protein
LGRVRTKLQYDILSVAIHVLVEAGGHHDAVVVPELALPEALEVVAAGVVGAGVLRVVEGGLAGGTAAISHWLEHSLAILRHDDVAIVRREDPRITWLRNIPLDVC